MKPNFVKITMGVGRVGYSFILKVNWDYISAEKLESESSKRFAVSISPQTMPHQQIVYRVRDIKISRKFREI